MLIEQVKVEKAGEFLPGLVSLLVSCVNHSEGISITFYPPLAPGRAEEYWLEKFSDVAKGRRILLVAREDDRVAGSVMLEFPGVDNQPHRGDVQKLLVHSDFRRRGLGTALMAALEETALAAGRTVLALDTLKDGAAESLYTRLGWQRVGEIPAYVRGPSGQNGTAVFFYKNLA